MTSEWRVVDKKGAQTVELDHEYALQKIREAIASYDWTRSTAEAYVSQILQSLLNSKGWRLDRPETLLPYIQAANLPIDGDLERGHYRKRGATAVTFAVVLTTQLYWTKCFVGATLTPTIPTYFWE